MRSLKKVIKRILARVIKTLPENMKYSLIVKTKKDITKYMCEGKRLTDFYFNKTQRELNFDAPRTFNEKIQWLKLYYHSENLERAVDKCEFKKYIKEKLGEGYTVPMYGAWKNVKDIKWDKLPKSFVLKSNCCSDGMFIKVIKDKDKVNFEELKKELSEWLNPYKTLVNSCCRAYWNVTPMILAEKYVEQIDGQVYDYKFFCFNGNPEFAYVATDHFEGQVSKISIYDLEWNLLDITYGHHPRNQVPAPKSLEKMIEISKILSKDFPFVRVDFFEVDEKPILSELTFYPGGGFNKINPQSVDEKWGEMITLPEKTKI